MARCAMPSYGGPAMTPASSGVLSTRSHHTVAVTLDRLEALARARGLIVFARIDFSADAQRAGLTLRPMQQLVFGDPKAGTPLLAASPQTGLDLPLRALAWQDADGVVWVSSNDPGYIAARHGLTDELSARISGARGLIERAAGEGG
jgi:uncharacterized protein (DUF302 family)